MTSAGDCDGVISGQPNLVLPEISIDSQTHAQMTPQSPPEAVDDALLELIQSVQHELRTPLHGILGLMSSLFIDMKKEIATTGNEQRVSDINALGGQLVSILDDFRDYASHTIEAKVAEINHEIEPTEEAELGNILDDIASEVWNHQIMLLQAEKGPEVRIPPPPEIILTLDTSVQSRKSLVSVDSFKRVARKLIDNALRFTNGEGYVEISLASHRMEDAEKEFGDQSAKSFLRLSVEDTGMGMTKEFVSEQLFTPFAKANAFKSGAGLSMALCSSLIRKMGGSMSVSSDHGRGTTVNVLVPVTNMSDTLEVPPSRPSSSDQLVYFHKFDGLGLRRLAGSISSQLATYGDVYTTTDVKEADYILVPEEVCYGDQNDELDRLLKDAQDGVKIAVLQAHENAKIGVIARKNGSPPPLYVTRKPFGPRNFLRLIQMAVRGDPQDTSRLGSSEYEKKTSLEEVLQNTTTHTERRSSNHTLDLVTTTDMSDQVLRGTPPAVRMLTPLWGNDIEGQPDAPPRTFTALCVEDNALNMRILTRLMSQCKVEFGMAVDGVEAVEQFEKSQPALILMDINMPNMNGYDASKEIRCRQGGAETHIIAITALSDDFSKKKGLEDCGMDEWLCKPLDIVKFKERIEALKEAFGAS